MYIYIYIYIHICVCVYVWACVYMCVCVCMCVYVYTYPYVCTDIRSIYRCEPSITTDTKRPRVLSTVYVCVNASTHSL